MAPSVPPAISRTRRFHQALQALLLVAGLAAVGLAVYAMAGRWTAQSAAARFSAEMRNCAPDEPYPDAPVGQVRWALCHHRPAMVLFSSDTCRPCRMMDALVQMVKPDYKAKVVFIDARYDDPANTGLLRWGHVGTLPAALFLTTAGEVRLVDGLIDQARLRAELDRIAATGGE